MKIKLSPSLERADYMNMERDCRCLYEAGVSFFHYDIMDYSLYGTTKLAPEMIAQVNEKFPNVPCDVHITSKFPEAYMDAILPLIKGNYLTFYIETTNAGTSFCKNVIARGGKAAVSLYPATPIYAIEELIPFVSIVNLIVKDGGTGEKNVHPAMLKKIAKLRKLLDDNGRPDVEIAVDGSIDYDDIKGMLDAGANILVLGRKTAFNPNKPIQENIKELKDYINSLGYEAE